jgi:hypothetical protein
VRVAGVMNLYTNTLVVVRPRAQFDEYAPGTIVVVVAVNTPDSEKHGMYGSTLPWISIGIRTPAVLCEREAKLAVAALKDPDVIALENDDRDKATEAANNCLKSDNYYKWELISQTPILFVDSTDSRRR